MRPFRRGEFYRHPACPWARIWIRLVQGKTIHAAGDVTNPRHIHPIEALFVAAVPQDGFAAARSGTGCSARSIGPTPTAANSPAAGPHDRV
ncbi:MAG TPA: hypothetical protein DER64_04925 [Planctomycetaceae bacterium]|nr:hypothetical protein [Planctomycetaceae bacterium]